jgi:hypothetical protein
MKRLTQNSPMPKTFVQGSAFEALAAQVTKHFWCLKSLYNGFPRGGRSLIESFIKVFIGDHSQSAIGTTLSRMSCELFG